MIRNLFTVLMLISIVQMDKLNAQSTPPQVTSNIGKSMPQPIPQSPNVASLGKFGSYEVNLYNGLPEISIPIFEVKSGSLTLPISLDYHASGVKMFDPGSWVGYGWTLKAGGQVSRETRGEPDEWDYYSSPLYENFSVCGPTGKYTYLDYAWKGIYDTEPDIFSYSFTGKSGNFTLRHRGETPYLFPYAPYEITHSGTGTTSGAFGLTKFEIKDDEGTLFRFGENSKGQLAGEGTSVDRVDFQPLTSQTAWHLMDIISPSSNDQISLNYQSIGYAYISEPRTTVSVIDNCWAQSSQMPCPSQGIQPPTSGTNNSTIGQIALKEIYFDGGKIEFIAGSPRLDNFGGSSTLQTLDQIKIYSISNNELTLLKSIKFNYSYFGYSNNPNATVRLRLDKVDFKDASGNVVNSYKFDYHSNTFSWDQVWNLTPYPLHSKDYWGYYNAQLNTTLIPAQTISYTINNIPFTGTVGSANRETNPQYMKEGVLKKITFPTGGYTEFDFETHKYLENSVPTYTGGLRVTSIKSYSEAGASPVVKSYRYGDSETGYGFKNFFNELKYYHSETKIRWIRCMANGATNSEGGETVYMQRNYFGNSLMEMSSRDGSSVVYPVVTEYFGDPTSNIGKIVYEYDNKAYIGDSLQIILGPASSKNYRKDYSWKRGKLTRQTVYDVQGRKLSDKTVQYTQYNKSQIQIGTAVQEFTIFTENAICQSPCLSEFGDKIDEQQYLHTKYYQQSSAFLKTSETEILYPDGDLTKSLTNSSLRAYHPQYLQLLSETNHNTGNSAEKLIETTTYPFSYSMTGTLTGAPKAVKSLLDNHIYSIPIEKYATRQNSDGSNSRIISGLVHTFKENPSNLNHIIPDEIHALETTTGLTNFTPATFTTSAMQTDTRYKPRIKFRAYDKFGNVAEAQATKNLITCYLWGYQNSMPIAEIKNSDIGGSFSDLVYSADGTIWPSSTAYSGASFSINYEQTVQISLSINQTSGTPSAPPNLNFKIRNFGGSAVFESSNYQLGKYTEQVTLPIGQYTFDFSGQSYGSIVGFTLTLNYVQATSFPKVFYTSFEETGIAIAQPFTGKKINQGTYSLRLPTVAGKYWITWWRSSSPTGGPWTQQQNLITVPYSGGDFFTVTGTIVDEVRLFPEKATMSTYTYNPVLGMTSSNDANNYPTIYQYDSFGRLKTLRDHNQKILKTYTYHYKDQN